MTTKGLRNFTAITLCIILLFSALCLSDCCAKKALGNTQFFAVNLYSLPVQSENSLSSDKGSYRLSWMNNPKYIPESPAQLASEIFSMSFLLDKLFLDKEEYSKDFYTEFKVAQYFLRI